MKPFYAACVALSITHATFADTTLEFDAQGDDDSQTFLVKDGKVLMRSPSEDMLYDGKSMTMIDHQQRAYMVMDPEKMAAQTQAMQGQMQEQMQQMQQQLGPALQQMQNQMQAILDNPNITDEQKQMIQQQMAQLSGGGTQSMPSAPTGSMPARQPTTVKATGQTRKVRGIKCKVHVVSRSARTVQEVCVATHQAAGVPRDDYKTLRGMFAFMREGAEKAMGAMGMESAGPMFPEFDGVPVEIKDLEDGTVSTLRKVSTKGLKSSLFRVPAGYQKHDPFM